MFTRGPINKDDTIHQIYSNQKIKQQLLNYIYTTVDISKFKYKILENKEELPILSVQPYLISGEYNGSNCFMVFTKNKDRFYSFLVERKTLTFRLSQNTIDNVSFIPVEIRLEEHIYDGTIFDGIYTFTNGLPVFIINDVYYFRGMDMMNEKINYKMINVKTYLDNFSRNDKQLNNVVLHVNKLYPLENIKNFVEQIIPNTKDFVVKGISFYPELSGTKIIYLFNGRNNNQLPNTSRFQQDPIGNKKTSNYVYQNKNLDNQVYPKNMMYTNNHSHNTGNVSGIGNISNLSNTQQINKSNVSPTQQKRIRYVCKTHDPVIATFDVRKTDEIDVYKLFLVEKSTRDGKNILKSKKMGRAYIPTTDCSHMCKELTLKTGKALMKCKYNEMKEKWVPIEEDTERKYPDLVSSIEEKMELIEEYDSDEEKIIKII